MAALKVLGEFTEFPYAVEVTKKQGRGSYFWKGTKLQLQLLFGEELGRAFGVALHGVEQSKTPAYFGFGVRIALQKFQSAKCLSLGNFSYFSYSYYYRDLAEEVTEFQIQFQNHE